jgi:predicted metal-dependent peptidase
MTQDLNFKISRAKSALVLENAFIASIVCAMSIVLDATLSPPTLATDGERIWAHPDWIAKHTGDEIKWALAHETFHCVFQHFIRADSSRDWRKWNIAGDVVINVLLETGGKDKRKVGHRPGNIIWEASEILGGKTAQQLYDLGKTTEGVYRLLPDPPAGGGGGDGEPGEGEGQWDSVRPLAGDPSVQAEAAAKMQVRVAQAAAAAKMCGQMDANLERLVGEVLEPKVVWQDQLRHFFTKRARTDHSYARPNRRFMSQNLYLPGRSGVQLGDILIAIDLSGSVSDAELAEFTAEAVAIKVDCNPAKTHVLYFTDRIRQHDVFEVDDELVISRNGTGGTAFSPIFRWAEDHNIDPVACVVLTDLECSDFGPAPPYPVMWASTSRTKAPFGEVIQLRRTHA